MTDSKKPLMNAMQPDQMGHDVADLSDMQKHKILRYGEVDPGYRPEQEVRGNKYGYGSATFLDYLIPDKDPNLKHMQQEPEEHTLYRYVHNRKKVFTWQQVSYAFGAVATLFGGLAVTGTAGSALQAFGFLKEATAATVAFAGLSTALGIGVACALGAFVAGYYAFRSDMKNDVDIEEMQAKRVGYHVGKNLEKLLVVEGKLESSQKASQDASKGASDQEITAQQAMTGPLNHISHAHSHSRLHSLILQAHTKS